MKIEEYINSPIIALLVIASALIAITSIITNVFEKDLALRRPVIQQVGIPFYFTNTVVVLIPTNSIPLTNVVTKP